LSKIAENGFGAACEVCLGRAHLGAAPIRFLLWRIIDRLSVTWITDVGDEKELPCVSAIWWPLLKKREKWRTPNLLSAILGDPLCGWRCWPPATDDL
jgi:hypothetical protein